MYLDSNPDPDRMCYSHLTCATGPVINPQFKHSSLYKCRDYTVDCTSVQCTHWTVQVYSVHIVDCTSVQCTHC